MISHKTSHTTEAIALLLTQLSGAVNLQALLTTYVTQVQEVEDALFAVLEQCGIDSTVGGEVLDLIGERVGCPRNGNSDDNYRLRLRIQLLVNNSNGRAIDFQRALLLLSQYARVEDGYGAVTIDVDQCTATAAEIEVARQTIGLLKAAGVRALYRPWQPAPRPYFSFGAAADADGESAGFGAGAFGDVYELL